MGPRRGWLLRPMAGALSSHRSFARQERCSFQQWQRRLRLTWPLWRRRYRAVRAFPPDKLLPDRQPSWVASFRAARWLRVLSAAPREGVADSGWGRGGFGLRRLFRAARAVAASVRAKGSCFGGDGSALSGDGSGCFGLRTAVSRGVGGGRGASDGCGGCFGGIGAALLGGGLDRRGRPWWRGFLVARWLRVLSAVPREGVAASARAVAASGCGGRFARRGRSRASGRAKGGCFGGMAAALWGDDSGGFVRRGRQRLRPMVAAAVSRRMDCGGGRPYSGGCETRWRRCLRAAAAASGWRVAVVSAGVVAARSIPAASRLGARPGRRCDRVPWRSRLRLVGLAADRTRLGVIGLAADWSRLRPVDLAADRWTAPIPNPFPTPASVAGGNRGCAVP